MLWAQGRCQNESGNDPEGLARPHHSDINTRIAASSETNSSSVNIKKFAEEKTISQVFETIESEYGKCQAGTLAQSGDSKSSTHF